MKNTCRRLQLGLLAGGCILTGMFNNCGAIIQRQLEILLAPEVIQTAYLLPLSGIYPHY